jgi:GntR family transcriptional regulator/MocR family aminotransferase
VDHQNGRVLYVGTFSKTIFPSLKLGCLVVPPDLVDVFSAARILSGAQSPLLEQAILSEFIAEGHFARHIRRMRTLYKERQNILIDEVRRNLQGLLEMETDDAGMHLVGWLPDNFDDRKVSEKAAAENIRLSPMSEHFINKNQGNGLLFGYAAFDEKRIRNGIAKLTKVLTEMARLQSGSIQKNRLDVSGNGDLRFAGAHLRNRF